MLRIRTGVLMQERLPFWYSAVLGCTLPWAGPCGRRPGCNSPWGPGCVLMRVCVCVCVMYRIQEVPLAFRVGTCGPRG